MGQMAETMTVAQLRYPAVPSVQLYDLLCAVFVTVGCNVAVVVIMMLLASLCGMIAGCCAALRGMVQSLPQGLHRKAYTLQLLCILHRRRAKNRLRPSSSVQVRRSEQFFSCARPRLSCSPPPCKP
jgi:hypothetical protein